MSEVKLLKIPKIILRTTRKLTNRIKAYIDNYDKEISWLGLVERTGRFSFELKEVYLVKQNCSAATTEMDPQDLIRLDAELSSLNILSKKSQETKGLYFWGHSHHNMGTSPSGQDNTQFKALSAASPYFFRQIANKRGDNNMSLILPDENILVNKLEFTYIEEAVDVESIKKEIAEKVHPFPPMQSFYSNHVYDKNTLYGLEDGSKVNSFLQMQSVRNLSDILSVGEPVR